MLACRGPRRGIGGIVFFLGSVGQVRGDRASTPRLGAFLSHLDSGCRKNKQTRGGIVSIWHTVSFWHILTKQGMSFWHTVKNLYSHIDTPYIHTVKYFTFLVQKKAHFRYVPKVGLGIPNGWFRNAYLKRSMVSLIVRSFVNGSFQICRMRSFK